MKDQLRILRTAQEIEGIAVGWRKLLSPSGPALSDPEWYFAAARIRRNASEDLAVLALWDDSRLVAVAPLQFTRSASGFRYEILGSRSLYEPTEVLASDESAADRMAREMVALGYPLLLSRLPADDAFSGSFTSQARSAGILLSPRVSGSPYVVLDGGWERYFEVLSSRVRNILRRANRALGKLGRVEFEFHRPGPSEVSVLLEAALQVELLSWKARAGSAVLQRSELSEFFRHYAPAAATCGELLISFLKFDGVPIAMQVAHVGRSAYRQLKIGYDERHSKYLPGLQLQLETLRWSFEQKLATYEFLGTEEPWIREWTSSVREYRTWLFYPANFRGAKAFACDGFDRIGRRIWGRRT